uniref:Uncharacterized protein n=1 Tax=Setaria viridis TaxID=4556 RepID=A0A4U6TQF8_SETVI|nr:hypothetical protein SEVIR_8G066250v2 [Setaria viridis]
MAGGGARRALFHFRGSASILPAPRLFRSSEPTSDRSDLVPSSTRLLLSLLRRRRRLHHHRPLGQQGGFIQIE